MQFAPIALFLFACVVMTSAFPRDLAAQFMNSQFPSGDYATEEFIRPPSDYTKRRSQLRNCFLSPVQCLLPVDDQRFSKYNKRFL